MLGEAVGEEVGEAVGEAVGEGDDVWSAQAVFVNDSDVAISPAATMGISVRFMPPLPG